MEHLGALFEGEWNSFNGMCSEEADFMAHLLENCSIPNELASGLHYAGSDESLIHSSDETNASVYSFAQGSSYSGGSSFFLPYSSHESYYPGVIPQTFVASNNLMAMDYCMLENKNNSSRIHIITNNLLEGDDFRNQEVSNDSIESNEDLPEVYLQQKNLQLGREIETPLENRISSTSEMSNKKPRILDGEFQKSKKLKKSSKVDNNDVDENNVSVLNKQQISSSFCSDDDSIASRELNGVSSSSSGAPKTRASRGSATDPQSLYARKRRERINERLRILQNLVPNGTKVDISTMLEEAVEYVKFLQLQIKLLSSDDHWMYAPFAYNGMEIGLDLKISASLS